MTVSGTEVEKKQKTYEFLYQDYEWPAEGTQRTCPFSGAELQLNEKRSGYAGKPWTCPRCIWYFSEEELKDPDRFKGQHCPDTQKKASEEGADGVPVESLVSEI
ncbi:hypothetical protein ACFLZR_01895 [Candidatus Neomarinimicrobiota bacterium]